MNTAVAVNPSNTMPPVVPSVQDIPLNRIQESKTNPRRTFDEAKLAELAQHLPAWHPAAHSSALCRMARTPARPRHTWTPGKLRNVGATPKSRVARGFAFIPIALDPACKRKNNKGLGEEKQTPPARSLTCLELQGLTLGQT
jgi:hypothetical protein